MAHPRSGCCGHSVQSLRPTLFWRVAGNSKLLVFRDAFCKTRFRMRLSRSLILAPILIISVIFAGCEGSVPDRASKAAVRGKSVRRGYANWDAVGIVEIEGKPAPVVWTDSQFRFLPPGERSLVLAYRGCRSIFQFYTSDLIPIRARFEANKKYEIAVEGQQGKVSVWVEELPTNRRISEPVTAAMRPDSPMSRVPAPIFIPVGN